MWRQKLLFKQIIVVILVITASSARSLPIGFGIHQDKIKYKQLKDKDFHFYYQQNTESEARHLLKSLNESKHVFANWFQIKRKYPLSVISSSVTANPFFANFITDTIELQSMGQGKASTAWHEYAHMMTYQYLHNIFGHAGSLLHLPWMPAWWLEGLAEALTYSLGSSHIYGVERHNVLSDSFMTYDQLHSIYGSYPLQLQGYSTSGRYVAFILQKLLTKNPNALFELHKDFFNYTLPWQWLLTVIPFADTMPLDRALKKHTGYNAKELYEQYKQQARERWQEKKQTYLANKGRDVVFENTMFMQNKDNKLYNLSKYKNGIFTNEVVFKQGRAVSYNKTTTGVKNDQMAIFSARYGANVYISYRKNIRSGILEGRLTRVDKQGNSHVLHKGWLIVNNIFATDERVLFIEHAMTNTRLCYYFKDDWQNKHCLISEETPRSLSFLGYNEETGRIWLRISTDASINGQHKIVTWQEDEGLVRKNWNYASRPMRITFVDGMAHILLAERKHRSVIVVDDKLQCVKKIQFANLVTDVFNHNQQLVLALYHHLGNTLAIPTADEINNATVVCGNFTYESSPLFYAIKQPNHNMSLLEATASFANNETIMQVTKTADKKIKTENAEWGGRPLFIFPTAMKGDVLGWQLGVISVPLMDNLQNEMLIANIMYGLRSQYPSVDLSLMSTRFYPALKFSLFKRQTYNGIHKGSVSFYDEQGMSLSATTSLHFNAATLAFTLGLSTANLTNYVGSPYLAQGLATHILSSLTWIYMPNEEHSLTLSLWNNCFPSLLNDAFVYYRSGLNLDLVLGLPFYGAELVSGADINTTRGEKSKNLKELYRPLNTNIISLKANVGKMPMPIIEGKKSIFSTKQGDTSAKVRTALIFPLLANLDKMLWIFYAERLNLTAFLNYGTAWRSKEGVELKDFVFAHGYSVDLLLNNKGVGATIGIGTGQVLGEAYTLYANIGFGVTF